MHLLLLSRLVSSRLKVKVQPLVGYLLAGVLIGPFTPGYVGDLNLASQLADMGVILLMFGVGLHFSLDEILEARMIVAPGTLVQVCCVTVIGAILGRLWGWTVLASLILGLSISIASTIVLLRNFEQRNALASPEARIAIGWAILQDLIAVLTLVLLPEIGRLVTPGTDTGTGSTAFVAIILTIAKIVGFVAFALLVGKRAVPWMLMQGARTALESFSHWASWRSP